MSETPALVLDGVRRVFHQGHKELVVLDSADLALAAGELVALVAPSGAGKSTLLHLAGLLETPDGGDVAIDGRSCGAMGDGERTRVRRRSVGFVYQFHHLLPEFSALENVAMPQRLLGAGAAAAADRARDLLGRVGLTERADHRPGKLSGGEQQRVAICRALANRPHVLLADEPTGNLDVATADRVFGVLIDQCRAEGLAGLIATHDPRLAARADRIVTLADGRVVPA